MCTGFEWLMGLTSVAGTVAPLLQKAPEPPPTPAMAPDAARAPGATVRVGSGQDKATNTDAVSPEKIVTGTTRAKGTALPRLGRAGLAL